MRKRSLPGAVGVSLAVVLAAVAYARAQAPRSTAEDPAPKASADETALFEAINSARVEHGRRPFPAPDRALSRAARLHSEDLQRMRDTSNPHGSTSGETLEVRIRTAAPGLRRFAENVWVGYGYEDPASVVAAAIDAWLSSRAGHRGVLLDAAWDVAGVGVARGLRPDPRSPGRGAVPYWTITADFGSYAPAGRR